MSTFKPRLSRAEEAEYFESLGELQAEGVDVGQLEEDDLPVTIQVGSSIENFVFDRYRGTAAHYASYLQIVANNPGIVIADGEITGEFDDDILLESNVSERVIFDFCGQHFHRDTILNERIEQGLRFHYRGQMIEGWILGSGSKPIPQEFGNESCTWLQLSFFDPLGRKAEAKAPPSVLRSSRPPEQAPQSEKGLYAGPIPGPDFEEEVHLSLLELRAEKMVQKENPEASLAEQERLTQELFKKMCADRQKMKLEYTNSLLARAARVAR